MLMLSTFLRVPEVSALVLDHAAADRAAQRHRTARATLTPPHATLARAPEPPEPADAHPAPLRCLLCFAPPLGFACADHPAAWGRARRPHRALLPRRRAGRRPLGPAPGAAPHAAVCVAGQGRLPLPLTSGARWSGGIFLLFVV